MYYTADICMCENLNKVSKYTHRTLCMRQHHVWLWPAEKHFGAAVEGYSRAIELNPLQAVYWSNRAAAHIRLENYGSALTDATKAIELNPKYIKAKSPPKISVLR